MVQKEAFLNFKKYEIFTQSWLPKEPTSHHVFIIHGLGEHSSSYDNMAKELCARGIACYGTDLIGHGKSSGQRGYVPNFEIFIEQLEFVFETLCKTYKIKSFATFAHSMGGLIQILKLSDQAFTNQTQLVLSNPLLGINVEIPKWKTSLASHISQFLPRLALSNEIDDNHLTKDKKMIELYKQDPLRHQKISSKLFIELQDNIDKVQKANQKFDLPTLLLLSPSDKVCDSSATQKFSKNFKNLDLQLFPQSGHEIVNDLSKIKAFDLISKFMKEQ